MSTRGILIGTAGVYHVMAQLALRGFHASCTHGNAPFIDIIVSSVDGSRSLSIQVKAAEHAGRMRGRGTTKSLHRYDFVLGHKAARMNSPSVFLAFVDFNLWSQDKLPIIYFVPTPFIFGFCREWVDLVPMVRFQPLVEQLEPYREAWKLIESQLHDPAKLNDQI